MVAPATVYSREHSLDLRKCRHDEQVALCAIMCCRFILFEFSDALFGLHPHELNACRFSCHNQKAVMQA